MNLRALLATLTLIGLICSNALAIVPVTPDASPEARALLNYLYAMKGKKTLSGQMYAPWNPHDEIQTVFEITGKYPAIRGGDMIHEDQNDHEIKLMLDWWKAGGIPTLMWHWGAPGKGEGFEQSKMTIDIDKCFEKGTPENKAMLSDFKRVADHLQVLRDAHVPVLWRPMHELDGNWFWWSKGGPERYKKLWVAMFNYFAKERKLNNLIWVACHSGEPKAAWSPGIEYVDLGGPDTYGKGIQAGLYHRAQGIYGTTVPIPYHECGTLPDPDECFKQGVTWSWWMLWHTGHLDRHNKDDLKRIYNSDLVITRDELPKHILAYLNVETPTTRPTKK